MRKSVLALLLCAIAAITLSCNKDNDSNTPLTNETIVGKKYFSDKVIAWDENSYYGYSHFFNWQQTEILFAENNSAYLTCITTDYENGSESRDDIKKASFNMAYPNVIFEVTDNNGNVMSYYGTFTDNNNFVFDGQLNQDFERYGSPKGWNQVHGVSFSKSPNTVTGPYLGQVFEYSYDIDGNTYTEIIRFGINYLSIGFDLYTFEINYPEITLSRLSGGYLPNATGHFIDENTLVLGEHTYIRTR